MQRIYRIIYIVPLSPLLMCELVLLSSKVLCHISGRAPILEKAIAADPTQKRLYVYVSLF